MALAAPDLTSHLTIAAGSRLSVRRAKRLGAGPKLLERQEMTAGLWRLCTLQVNSHPFLSYIKLD